MNYTQNGFCPQCKQLLVITENTYNGVVFQRVVSCDTCGYVYKFDADENNPVVQAIRENQMEMGTIKLNESI